MKKTNIIKVINIFVYTLLFLILLFLWKTGVLRWMIQQGENIIQTVPSPDQQYVAYVQEHPSIDPPNQS